MISIQPYGNINQYTLTNANGIRISFINYGGAITELICPDRTGQPGDVVLGFNSLEGYTQKDNPYIGALIGRFGNRIAKGKFELEGRAYQLATNNMGNALHGGLRGFDKVYWEANVDEQHNSIIFSYHSPDGEEGYPGNLDVTVTYQLNDQNELIINYSAVTDQATPVNLTNHAYFNLSAGADETILDHNLQLNADRFTAIREDLIPTGDLSPVAGGPMDFREGKKIGKDIDLVAGGYDHNWVTNGQHGSIRSIAILRHERSGRVMEVLTTQPGVQFYSGNFLDGTLHDTKYFPTYNRHAGLCLETQHFPDSPNQSGFPNTILRPGEMFKQQTIYRFSVSQPG